LPMPMAPPNRGVASPGWQGRGPKPPCPCLFRIVGGHPRPWCPHAGWLQLGCLKSFTWLKGELQKGSAEDNARRAAANAMAKPMMMVTVAWYSILILPAILYRDPLRCLFQHSVLTTFSPLPQALKIYGELSIKGLFRRDPRRLVCDSSLQGKHVYRKLADGLLPGHGQRPAIRTKLPQGRS